MAPPPPTTRPSAAVFNASVPADRTMRSLSVSDTHVLVVYFGDKTYEWRESDALLDFLEHKDELAEQRFCGPARGFDAASLWRTSGTPSREGAASPPRSGARWARRARCESTRRAVGAVWRPTGAARAYSPAIVWLPVASARATSRPRRRSPSRPGTSSRAAAPRRARRARGDCSDRTAHRQSARRNALCPQIGAIARGSPGARGRVPDAPARACRRHAACACIWPDEADEGPSRARSPPSTPSSSRTPSPTTTATSLLRLPAVEGDRAPGGPGGRAGGGGARAEAGTGRFEWSARRARDDRATRAAARARNAEREPARPPGPRGPGRPPATCARDVAGARRRRRRRARAEKGMRRGVMTDEKRETKKARDFFHDHSSYELQGDRRIG